MPQKKAGIIYAFAIVATMDTGGAETKEEDAVVTAAVDFAREQLAKLGLSVSDVLSLPACIAHVKRANTASKKDSAS